MSPIPPPPPNFFFFFRDVSQTADFCIYNKHIRRKNAVFAREKVQEISPGAGLVIITASPIQQYNDANLFLTIRKTISNYEKDEPWC